MATLGGGCSRCSRGRTRQRRAARVTAGRERPALELLDIRAGTRMPVRVWVERCPTPTNRPCGPSNGSRAPDRSIHAIVECGRASGGRRTEGCHDNRPTCVYGRVMTPQVSPSDPGGGPPNEHTDASTVPPFDPALAAEPGPLLGPARPLTCLRSTNDRAASLPFRPGRHPRGRPPEPRRRARLTRPSRPVRQRPGPGDGTTGRPTLLQALGADEVSLPDAAAILADLHAVCTPSWPPRAGQPATRRRGRCCLPVRWSSTSTSTRPTSSCPRPTSGPGGLVEMCGTATARAGTSLDPR